MVGLQEEKGEWKWLGLWRNEWSLKRQWESGELKRTKKGFSTIGLFSQKILLVVSEMKLKTLHIYLTCVGSTSYRCSLTRCRFSVEAEYLIFFLLVYYLVHALDRCWMVLYQWFTSPTQVQCFLARSLFSTHDGKALDGFEPLFRQYDTSGHNNQLHHFTVVISSHP